MALGLIGQLERWQEMERGGGGGWQVGLELQRGQNPLYMCHVM